MNALLRDPVAQAQPPLFEGAQVRKEAARRKAVKLSVVVPCFNEARNLELLLPQLNDLLPELAQSWEVVLVDDGSRDETPAVLRQWALLPGFRALLLSRNFGKEAALTAGLEAARGDVVVMLDADMQHPPGLIREMFARWQDGADVAYAVRENRDDEGTVKRFGTSIFYKLLNRFHRFEVPPGAGDFRLLDRAAVDAILRLPERNRFMKGLYAWIGFESVAVAYSPEARAHGKSSYNFARLVNLSLDGLTSFTTWPLRIVSVVGILIALIGFGYGGWLTLSYFVEGNDVPGWTTVVVSLMCFIGVQMIFLGIIGEYIARIFEEVKGRPLYVVRRELGRGLAGERDE